MSLRRRLASFLPAFSGRYTANIGFRRYSNTFVRRFLENIRNPGIQVDDHELVDGNVGQPTPETHPELLRPGEIVPGISANQFASRRSQVWERMSHGSVMIIPSAPIQYMAGIVPYPYRQDSDYLYLTGCTQPGGIAVLEKPRFESEVKFKMFMPQNKAQDAIWNGTMADEKSAIEFFGAHQSFPINQFSAELSCLLSSASAVYCDPSQPWILPESTSLAKLIASGNVRNMRHLTHKVRWRKSDSEIAMMKKSASIISQAFLAGMVESTKSDSAEHSLGALLEYECRRRGAQRMAFPSVVASGASAATIHYSRCDRPVDPSRLLLVDAGCEVHGYCSDVTRVWSPGGHFSGAQRDVYNEVYNVLQRCTEMCLPGNTLAQIHQHSVKELSKSISRLGLLAMAPSEVARGPFSNFYPTAIGHWLGMDTHDCRFVSHDEPLQPGVVLTIEPGLYIPNSPDVPQRYRGIGVRIEDDILITENGHQVLTASVPKEIAHLEGFIRQF